MREDDLQAQAAQFLYQEAFLLDSGNLEDWLELFTPDCVFWMPAWRDDNTQTDDPECELSLIYYRGRRNLEDRVGRIRSGFSVASIVMPRVAHLIGNVMASETGADEVQVHSSFHVSVHDVRTGRDHTYFGRYEHLLAGRAGEWRIARKVIRLMNDIVPTSLDIFAV